MIIGAYHISWNETKYNANNTTGWEATKSNDETEIPTIYDWNGTAWLSSLLILYNLLVIDNF